MRDASQNDSAPQDRLERCTECCLVLPLCNGKAGRWRSVPAVLEGEL